MRDEVVGMLRLLVAWTLILCHCSLAAAASPDERLKRLPEKYRLWLEEEVPYIITKVERERFLNLSSVEEWDALIEAFWRKRDDNPTTPENEFREEHYKRLAYVNDFFARDTFRPGWMTDRGRYYVVLGPPTERQNLESQDAIYPAELWFYNNPDLKRFGLPPFFYLLFFRRHGGGELALYSPVLDGPQALLTGRDTRSMDFRQGIERAYNKLYEISPELAQASLSFRTDEGDIVQFQTPAFGTASLLDDIRNAPFRGVDTSYAENLDVDKGLVESDYLFSYVPSSSMVSVLPGPGGFNYLHWVIEIEAQHIGLVKDPDRGALGTLFIISTEITARGDPQKKLLESRKESFLNVKESEAEGALRSPFAYSGLVPVAPGSYDLRIVLRNRACTSREESSCRKAYTILEAPLDVPELQPGSPRLSDVVLAYGTEPRASAASRAYGFGATQLLPNPRRVFSVTDRVVALVEAPGAGQGHQVRFRIVNKETGAGIFEKSVPAAGVRLEPLIQEFSLEGVAPGFYQLLVELRDASGRSLATRVSDFDVTPRNTVARPGIRGSWAEISPEVPGMVEAALGSQYLNLGEREKAREFFEAAVAANSRLGPAREALASLLLEQGNAGRAIELLEPVYAQVQNRFEALALLGEAHLKNGNYSRAAEILEKALPLRRPDTRLLNFLAVCHYRLGNPARAREYLDRSLSLQPEQPEIKALLEKLKSNQ